MIFTHSKLFLVGIAVFCLFILTSEAQSTVALTAKEISKLLPENIMKSYSQSGEPKSKVLKVGTLRYALSERNFSSGKRKIKILLFDYLEAPIMYSQATKRFSTFSEVETDSVARRPIVMENGDGWESDNIKSQSSQILLGIYDRYYLTIEGDNVPLEELKMVLELIQVENFPHTSK